MSHSVQITDYEVKYKLDFGGDEGVQVFLHFYNGLNEMLRAVSKMYAFDDCEPVEIVSIKAEGRELAYCGWMPGMEYNYYDKETGEIVWTEYFPEWDH